MTAFYFESASEFPEIAAFVHETDQRFGLRLRRLQGSFKERLEELVAGACGAPPMRGVVLGTREGDPNAPDQSLFCPSSDGWPPFMRVNPVLDWTYREVWDFLHTAGVPYSQLYDEGYTSLGSVENTERNPCLRQEDGSYRPAYFLEHGSMERFGRTGGGAGGAGAGAGLRRVVIVAAGSVCPVQESGLQEGLFAAKTFVDIVMEAGRGVSYVCRAVAVSEEADAEAEVRRARSEGSLAVLLERRPSEVRGFHYKPARDGLPSYIAVNLGARTPDLDLLANLEDEHEENIDDLREFLLDCCS